MLASQALCGAASRRAHRGPALPREAGRGRVSTKQTHVPTSRPELTRQGSRILQKVQTQNSKTISAEAKTSSVCLIQIAKYSHPLCPWPGGSGLGPVRAEKQARVPTPLSAPRAAQDGASEPGPPRWSLGGCGQWGEVPQKRAPRDPCAPPPLGLAGTQPGKFLSSVGSGLQAPPCAAPRPGEPPQGHAPGQGGAVSGPGSPGEALRRRCPAMEPAAKRDLSSALTFPVPLHTEGKQGPQRRRRPLRRGSWGQPGG